MRIDWEGKWEQQRGFWVYFRVRLDRAVVREQYQLPDFVEYDEWDGRVAGAEAGFQCRLCESAIEGVHPAAASGHPVFPTAMDAPPMNDSTGWKGPIIGPSLTPELRALASRSLVKDLLPVILSAAALALAIAFGWWAGKRP